ncbi:MAG TPA: Holliday junction resolvase RuvX [Candidatus Binataceae bacterium]|nr:Holliday junction resolvase RuvX [Candidatus Binataceae bacterium]
MSILGLDLGKRRIGVAIADSSPLGVRPLTTLFRTSLSHDLEGLRAIVVERQVSRIVLGLPLNMNGSEGPAARHTRAFAGWVAQALAVPVDLYDERLTSFEAESRLKESSLKRDSRKLMVDQVAAALILEGWLAEHEADREEA